MTRINHVSLIIPCKNEEAALPSFLSSLPAIIDEVIVIDNKSSDRTIKVAKKFGAKILFEPKQVNGIGYGYAIMRGIKEATGNLIVCMDGDNSYPSSVIPQIVKLMQDKKIDFVSCNRLPLQNPKKMSSIRTLGIAILNFLIWFFFGYKVKDSLSGMWIFNRETAKKMTLTQGNWNLSLEIKLSALIHPDIKFEEHHISYQDRILGLSKQNLLKTGLEHVFFLLKVKLALLQRRPAFSSQPAI